MSSSTRVRFFTEAGPTFGLGHLTRCVALYDAFEKLGCVCDLHVQGDPMPHVAGARVARKADWGCATVLAESLSGVDIAVIDSYRAGTDVYERAANAVSVGVYLDDTARLPYPQGIVVNGSPGAARLEWPPSMVARPMLGADYQLLRREFADPVVREFRSSVERVLVISGGTDAAGILDELRRISSEALPDAEIDAVVKPRGASEMRDAMLQADIAVSAAGQTLYELAATGTPTVAVTVADNQVPQAAALAAAHAILLAGSWGNDDTVTGIGRLLGRLRDPEVRGLMSAAGRALVDGRGPKRVARAALEAAGHIL